MSDRFSISINPRIHNKPPQWEPEFADHWQQVTATVDDLRDLIRRGTAFIPAAMNSSHRSSAAFLHADLVVVDIDGGMDLEAFAAHELSASALLLYTTASHQDRPGAHRFRVIFRLKQRIHDPELYKALVTDLIRELGGDKNCTDPCRLFYACSYGQQRLLHPEAVLPDRILERAAAQNQQSKQQFSARGEDYDDITLLQAAFVLDEILEPTSDGERDRFVRITAAAASGGDALYASWSDWASRGHHGKGKNSRQTSERFFRGFSGRSSLATLFFFAAEADPHWRKRLPEALRSSGGSGPSLPAAGYSHEDFLGEPDDLEDLATIDAPRRIKRRTPSAFELTDAQWAAMEATAVESPDDAPDPDSGDDDDDDLGDFDDSDDPLRKQGGGKSQANVVEEIDKFVRQVYPGLRLNQINLRIEYGTHAQPSIVDDPHTSWIPVSKAGGKTFAKTQVADVVNAIARENAYNPVRRYLEHCSRKYQPIEYFDELATTLLGVHPEGPRNPRMPNGELFANVVLRRFLVGAVARAFNPGCSHAWMLILIGPQNLGKSNFFQYLTPPDTLEGNYPWVSTIQQGISYLKDKPHALHAGWIALLDEVERYFKRQYTEELKNLISVSVDRSARKWENERLFPRSFVLAGNTNSDSFLVDPTGNRRFMPLSVIGKVPSPEDPEIRIIDLDRLKQDRNRIWAAAYQAYLDNPVHEFSSYELSQLEGYTNTHLIDTPLGESVRQVVERNCSFLVDGKPAYTMKDIFGWLDLGLESSTTMSRQVSDELRKLGFIQQQRRVAGVSRRFWQKGDPPNTAT